LTGPIPALFPSFLLHPPTFRLFCASLAALSNALMWACLTSAMSGGSAAVTVTSTATAANICFSAFLGKTVCSETVGLGAAFGAILLSSGAFLIASSETQPTKVENKKQAKTKAKTK
jgi:drug/metabolite transporter (DMT)-like permease